jgi:hypothetical protein
VAQNCKRCLRANPREAVYCYHDGILLGRGGGEIPVDGSAINIGARPFTQPFVFPSGQACHNFLQLADACQQERAAVLDLLSKGHLETFLAGQGRADLAGAALVAAHAGDRQRGLDEFLGRLPVPLPGARLKVEPSTLDLGTLRRGEDRRVELTLRNDGMRLLYGSAGCDVPWLALGEAPSQGGNKVFQFTDCMTLPVRILGQHLRALEKPQQAEILFDSSGGKAVVTISVYVPVQPFPGGVLSGARSPRQAAHKAKDAAKEAAALIESGALARWYEANGWTYPVLGPTATGVAAVQQFLEALGLVKIPTMELSEEAVRLRGRAGQRLEYSIAVITQENRAAIAHGSSDQPWLSVGPTIFRGRSAFLPLLVAAVPGNCGATLQAVVSVTANGGQRFAVPVTLTVSDAPEAAKAAPPAARPVPVSPAPPVARPVQMPFAQPAPAVVPVAMPFAPPTALAKDQLLPSAPPVSTGPRWSVASVALPALLLMALIGAAATRDYLAPGRVPPPPPPPDMVDSVPKIEIQFHDEQKNDELEKVWMTDHQPTMRFGVVTLHAGKEVGTSPNVTRLTFDPWGRTNNTCIRIDGTDVRLFGSPRGSWEERAAKSWKEQDQDHQGVRSVWVCDDVKIKVIQLVELVRGDQSHLLDTCRVRYQLVNMPDGQQHQVGIRFLLDTFIGANDGVPFTIPGETAMCDTQKDLPREAKDSKIPDFLQALEKADLAHPGTIARLRLKLEKVEQPVRVTLGAWPSVKLQVLDRLALGPSTLWDVPVLPIKTFKLNDSAVTIYWKEEPLKPGQTREVGFEYGLGDLVGQGSRLAATVDGAFRPDGELTVVAYVNRTNAQTDDETVTLNALDGFKFLVGDKTQHLPKLAKDVANANVPITWKLQAPAAAAKYELTVTSSSGLSQTLRLEIRKSIY